MELDLIFDKNSNTPMYRQFTNQLKGKIEKGEIKNGERLPTEREISHSTGISRGTVKKAYEELIRQGMILAVQGRGTFVIWDEDSEKDTVSRNICSSIEHMKDMGFSNGEMTALLNVMLEKELNPSVVNIASIDCNPETLEVFACQISAHYNVRFYPFLLNEVQGFLNGAAIFKNFDLVFTTTTHYEEIKTLLEGQAHKIIKAAVSPDMPTIVGLAGLTTDTKTGILTKSPRFAQIVNNNIKKTTGLKQEPQYYLLSNAANPEGFERFLEDTQMLIMPPFYTLQLSSRQEAILFNYIAGGGRIITFHYAIERGSLIHISDRISHLG